MDEENQFEKFSHFLKIYWFKIKLKFLDFDSVDDVIFG